MPRYEAPAQSTAFSASRITELTLDDTPALLQWQAPFDATTTNRLSWGTETRDGLGIWAAGSPTKITIATSGWYRMTFTTNLVAGATWARIGILINSTDWGAVGSHLLGMNAAGERNTTTSPVFTLHIPFVYLTSGDELYAAIIAGSTDAVSGDAETKWFIEKLD